jgi:hypothetical protein
MSGENGTIIGQRIVDGLTGFEVWAIVGGGR